MAMPDSERYELLKDIPAGAWVALSEKQHAVMAYGIDMVSVYNESRSKGEAVPLIVRIPEEDLIWIL